MSNKEIIKQLESLRDHCNEMIDKEDPEDIWRADTEALNEAIKAIAGLDIDQNKNGGINRMSEKTKVTIEHPDGHRKEVSADTVLCFAVDKGAEFMAGKVQIIEAQELFIGKDIPEPIFAETIGSLLASFVEKRQQSSPMMASYDLRTISKILEAKSKALAAGMTPEQKEKELHGAIENLVKAMFSR